MATRLLAINMKITWAVPLLNRITFSTKKWGQIEQAKIWLLLMIGSLAYCAQAQTTTPLLPEYLICRDIRVAVGFSANSSSTWSGSTTLKAKFILKRKGTDYYGTPETSKDWGFSGSATTSDPKTAVASESYQRKESGYLSVQMTQGKSGWVLRFIVPSQVSATLKDGSQKPNSSALSWIIDLNVGSGSTPPTTFSASEGYAQGAHDFSTYDISSNGTNRQIFPQLKITTNADKSTFKISKVPEMPVIKAVVDFSNLDQSTIQELGLNENDFQWKINISYYRKFHTIGRKTNHPAVDLKYSSSIYRLKGDDIYAPQFGKNFYGGNFLLTVTTYINGRAYSADTQSQGLKIEGENPAKSEVQAALGDDLLRRVACQESGQRQFTDSGEPYWNTSNDDGGVGVKQVTVDYPSADIVWNWRANVAEGIKIFAGKRDVAKKHLDRLLPTDKGGYFNQEVAKYNQERARLGKKPLKVFLDPPMYSAKMLDQETLRGNNGYGDKVKVPGWIRMGQIDGGTVWEWNLEHNDSTNLIIVAVNESTLTGVVKWKSWEGPRPKGDPAYVNNVMNLSPLCNK